ncbi:MAG TPA: arginase family protein [Solirubrobacterales bacterium]|nr:arginase family protein [Solirubrobacterales bacterium]
MRSVAVIGVPTSAGAFAPGQERAPAALREAGLVEALEAAELEVDDRGDSELWRWRPDREERQAQNLGRVVSIVRETADRVAEAATENEVTLVLGGDCTVGIGTVAGHVEADEEAEAERVGVLYFDTHADLNVPASVREGALDWMGMAHMLGVEGARAELVEAGDRAPLLDPDQVLLFGWGPEQATPFEADQVRRLGIVRENVEEVAADPEGAAVGALALLEPRCERLLVHFDVDVVDVDVDVDDVDVVDFTDTPLSENTGRNEGLPFETALRALKALLAAPKLAALTITELNPDHIEEGSNAVERLVAAVAEGLAA